jgi:hypothetical protein
MILSNPLALIDWAGGPPEATDWERLDVDLQARLALLRRLLPLPFPLGMERSMTGNDDHIWVEGQYAQLIGLISSVRVRPVDGGRQLYGQAVLWCASFDREMRRRRRLARLFRLLNLVGAGLLLLLGLVGYQRITGDSNASALGQFLASVVQPLISGWQGILAAFAALPGLGWVSRGAMVQALSLVVLGIAVSYGLGRLLRREKWKSSAAATVLRVLFCSNLTIVAVVSSGAMGSITWSESVPLQAPVSQILPDQGGKGLPQYVKAEVYPWAFCFFVGYFIPILLVGGTLRHIVKLPETSVAGNWRRLRSALGAFATAFRVPPTTASPPETPPQSAPP